MNQKMNISFLLIAAALSPLGLQAQDKAAVETIKHPVAAYHEHELKTDQVKDVKFSQEAKEKEELLDQARKDYEKDLKEYGANNTITKAAKSRFDSAKKDYRKLVRKQRKAEKDLMEDVHDVVKDKATP